MNTNTSPQDALWSFFDRIYCISLKNREDRREAARREFVRVGLAKRVEFLLVDKAANPEQGIYESHIACLRQGLEAGAEHMLILEDDVVFRRFSVRRLAACVDFLRGHEWDAFFLGCMVRRLKKLPGLPVAHIRYRCLTHALALNRPLAERIVREHPWRGTAYDDFLRDLASPRMYLACPACAFQSDSPSDNDALLHLDQLRRRLGGLMFLQWLNCFWRRFFWWLLLGQSALFLALAWILWRLFR